MNCLEQNPALKLLVLGTLLLLGAASVHAQNYDKGVPKPTQSEVKYGPHERNVLDFWQAKGQGPRSLAFVIHGGGWNGGSKERAQRFVDVQGLLDAGISVVAINYRLIPPQDRDKHAGKDKIDLTQNPPVHAPLIDAARALQFVRSKSKAWQIDTNRIGAAGGSAGACSSLWLLYHDDLADPDSDDPIARQSTRLTCAAVQGAQTTLDPKQMKAWTPNSRYGGHAFGISKFDDFLTARDKILPWINKYSPYANVSKDDPPAYLLYWQKPEIGKAQRDPTHTSNFGVKLKEHCEKFGLACELNYPGAKGVKHKTNTAFLIAMLTAK